jgi:hypothetical protein
MTMNDDFLTKFRKAPRPEFAASLYQRISKPMNTQTKPQPLRFVALTLSLLAVLIAALLFSPSVRAFAQGFIRQVGGYVFTQEGSIDQNTKTPKDIQIDQTQDSVSIRASKNIPSATDPAEASQLAGFTVLAPTYLPDGYTSMSGWLVTHEGNSKVVTNGYNSGSNFFAINQAKFGAGASEQTFHRDQIIDVTVRGQSGVWLPAPADGKKALVWEENGISYSIISNSLSLDEMLKIAASLGK